MAVLEFVPDSIDGSTDVDIFLDWPIVAGESGWSSLGAVPVPRAGATAVAIGTRLYVAGGYDSTSGLDLDSFATFDTADPGAGWTALAALPSGRYYTQMAVTGGLLYLPGGATDTSDVDDFLVYDPADDAAGWVALTSLPLHVDSLQVAAVDGKVYCFGGFAGFGDDPDDSTVTSAIVYDTTDPGAGWTALTDLPMGRVNGTAIVDGTDIHLIGGYDPLSTGDYTLNYISQTFHTDDGTWGLGEIYDLPETFIGAGTVILPDEHRMYLIKGNGTDGMYIYDLVVISGWNPVTTPDYFLHLADVSAAVVGGVVYVLGGYHTDTGRSLPELIAYDTASTAPGVLYVAPIDGSTLVEGDIAVAKGPWIFDHAAGSTDVVADIEVQGGPLLPDVVAGSTSVVADIHTAHAPRIPYVLDAIHGRTGVHIYAQAPILLAPDELDGWTLVGADLVVAGRIVPDPVVGWTEVHIAGVKDLVPDRIQGSTAVTADLLRIGIVRLYPDIMAGSTTVKVMQVPDLGENTAILLAVSLFAELEPVGLGATYD